MCAVTLRDTHIFFPSALLLILLITALTSSAINVGSTGDSGTYNGGMTGLSSLLFIGSATFSADGIRGALVAQYDSEAGYVDVIASGIDYSPEPNYFDVNVVRLWNKDDVKVSTLVSFNEEVSEGFAPSANLLPGGKLGLNWTAVALADNRPYEEAPLSEIRVYGLAWDGSRLLGPKEIARINMGEPVFVLMTYPWPAEGDVTAFYASVPYFRNYKELMYGYGVLTYDLANHEVVSNVTLPVTMNRSGYDFIIHYVNTTGGEVIVKTGRYSVLFCPSSAEGAVGYAVVAYKANNNIYVLESRVDLSTGEAEGFKVLEVMKGYDIFLVTVGTDRDLSKYYVVMDFIRTSSWEHTIKLYEVGANGLDEVFSASITKEFNRAYVVYHDGLLLLLTQDDQGVITVNDLQGHEVQALELLGRFYARLISVPNPEWPNTYVLIIGVPAADTTAYFFIVNPPPGAATTTQTTTSASTTTTASTTVSTSSTTSAPATTSSATKTTTSATTSETQTSQSVATGGPANLVLGKGDWLKYHVKVSGKGPLGSMNFETDVKVTVVDVSNDHIKLQIEPLKSLTYEQRSLITMGAVTGNKLILALAADQPTTVTYALPLQPSSKACAILANPTGKEERVTDSGTSLGHEYSATCTYTSMGVLSSLTFKDVYSVGNQEVDVEITITLTDSSKDVGAAGGNLLGGFSLTTLLIISAVIAVAIVAAVLAIMLKKR